MLPSLGLVPAPPTLGVGRFFVQWRYSPVRQCPVFTWLNREASFLVLLATVPSGPWLFGILYFALEVRPPVH